MGYTFLNGSKLVVDYDGTKYELLVTGFEADQTFVEGNQNIKTIHDRELLKRSYVSKKENASFSFSYYVTTDGVSDGFIFDWFGFPKQVTGQHYEIDTKGDTFPASATLYIIDPFGATNRVDSAVIEGLSFTMTSNSILSITVSGTSSNFYSHTGAAVTADITQENRAFIAGAPIQCLFDIAPVNNFTLISMEISKSINWLDQRSLFDTNNYVSQFYYTDSLNITGTVESYKTNNNERTEFETPITFKVGTWLDIYLPNCHIAERTGVQDVFMQYKDYKMNPANTSGTIKFN